MSGGGQRRGRDACRGITAPPLLKEGLMARVAVVHVWAPARGQRAYLLPGTQAVEIECSHAKIVRIVVEQTGDTVLPRHCVC